MEFGLRINSCLLNASRLWDSCLFMTIISHQGSRSHEDWKMEWFQEKRCLSNVNLSCHWIPSAQHRAWVSARFVQLNRNGASSEQVCPPRGSWPWLCPERPPHLERPNLPLTDLRWCQLQPQTCRRGLIEAPETGYWAHWKSTLQSVALEHLPGTPGAVGHSDPWDLPHTYWFRMSRNQSTGMCISDKLPRWSLCTVSVKGRLSLGRFSYPTRLVQEGSLKPEKSVIINHLEVSVPTLLSPSAWSCLTQQVHLRVLTEGTIWNS